MSCWDWDTDQIKVWTIDLLRDCQDTIHVMWLFGKEVSAACQDYLTYVAKYIAQGRRSELVVGGLIRSSGGWSVVKKTHQMQDQMKSEELILGDGEFTQSLLYEAWERIEERYRFQAHDDGLDKITIQVSSEMGVEPDQVWCPANIRLQSKHSVYCVIGGKKSGVKRHGII